MIRLVVLFANRKENVSNLLYATQVDELRSSLYLEKMTEVKTFKSKSLIVFSKSVSRLHSYFLGQGNSEKDIFEVQGFS
jgi:hypothetical protein